MPNTDRSCSQCRRASEKLFLKGEKCFGPKCPMIKRNFAPGQHGPTGRRAKKSSYGKQLMEKQSAKRMYGLRERQFANYVVEAAKKTGDTSVFLIQYLESRLDNVVFRMGLAKSRAAGRQLVGHGHIAVNGHKVDLPSYRVKIGDTVAVYEKSITKKIIENLKEGLTKVEPPAWIGLDAKNLSAKILNSPTVDSKPFNAKVIIEFYSR